MIKSSNENISDDFIWSMMTISEKIIQLEKTLIGLLYITSEIKTHLDSGRVPLATKLSLVKDNLSQCSGSDIKTSGVVDLKNKSNQLEFLFFK